MFGEVAGRNAARDLTAPAWNPAWAETAIGDITRLSAPGGDPDGPVFGALFGELQTLLWDKVGLLRDNRRLTEALARIRSMQATDLPALHPRDSGPFAMGVQEWFDLRAALATAEAITLAALNRTESRGAHQREDMPATDPALAHNQRIRREGDDMILDTVPVRRAVIEDESRGAAE